ncbi:Cytochrome c oxidase subunit III [Methylocella tundrae]|uniref:Cytochrome c oxidase subunit III n=1 Tax=Methylocella tundrae TaxID=227605 RepID=A0A8B6MCQ0_METTU|nr:cytochrome c oxidase subunit 3 [Methylocella tundrae]VTZ25316.1 Cytochrome c oxidase subunit III [Methylocella tundrae]VTZ52079.1 Cytochrome c oxidase subunit III [Methylocella tundrae]
MSEIALGANGAGPVAIKGVSGVDPNGRASGWYGAWLIVATEGSLFAYVLFGYCYALLQSAEKWPLDGLPPLALASASTIVLIASSAALAWGQRCVATGATDRLVQALALTLALGVIFVGLQSRDWLHQSATISADAYHSFYVLTTGLDIVHATAGVIALAALLVWALLGSFDANRGDAVSIVAIYWHFIVIVWLFIFATFFLVPYLR